MTESPLPTPERLATEVMGFHEVISDAKDAWWFNSNDMPIVRCSSWRPYHDANQALMCLEKVMDCYRHFKASDGWHFIGKQGQTDELYYSWSASTFCEACCRAAWEGRKR